MKCFKDLPFWTSLVWLPRAAQQYPDIEISTFLHLSFKTTTCERHVYDRPGPRIQTNIRGKKKKENAGQFNPAAEPHLALPRNFSPLCFLVWARAHCSLAVLSARLVRPPKVLGKAKPPNIKIRHSRHELSLLTSLRPMSLGKPAQVYLRLNLSHSRVDSLIGFLLNIGFSH